MPIKTPFNYFYLNFLQIFYKFFIKFNIINTYYLTAKGSQISKSFILQIFPVIPLIPKNFPSGLACFALSSVKTLTTSAPQFYARVLGIISKA